MNLLNSLSAAALRQAANIKDKIQALEKELLAVLNSRTISISIASTKPTGKTKGKMSAAARARIATAQKKRWAKVNAARPTAKAAIKTTIKKSGMSAAAKAKLSAAAKARWAKVKAAGKKSL